MTPPAGFVKFSDEQIVTSGLVLNLDAGYLRSYTGSGTTWYDASSRGNNGTLINGPTFSSANGGSILFDGTNDYMSATISCSRTYYSIDWWTRPTAVSNYDQCIMMNSSGSAGSYWSGFTAHTDSSGTLYIGTNTGSNAVTSAGTLVNGVWHNFVWTVNNGFCTLYKNGSLVGSVTLSVHSADFTLLQIGAGPSFGEGTLFDGNCASLKLYSNKILTAAEVSQNFNRLRGRFGL
jgi:hypothetical protein